MRLITSRSIHPGFNLAAEEFLFLGQPEEALFLYVNQPCIVVGCNQSILAEADTTFCTANDIGLYRRMSGGGAVYHDLGNLNFCFITNRIPGESPLGANFLDPIRSVLTTLGVPVELGSRKDLWLPGGFKVTGTAAHVGKHRELHHGTLLYDTDLERLQLALTPRSAGRIKAAVASVPSPVRNIRSYLDEHGLETKRSAEFFEEFVERLHEQLPGSRLDEFSENERAEIAQIAEHKYLSADWTFKK